MTADLPPPPRSRFGEIAIRRGLLTQAMLDACIAIQAELKSLGMTKSMGAILHEKGYLTVGQVGDVIREMTGATDLLDLVSFPGYRLLGKIGEGATGSVYRACQEKLDRIVAVKVLKPEYVADPGFRERFTREVHAAARFDHAGIVRALSVGEEAGYCYLVMEYVPGRSLRDLLLDGGPFPEPVALELCAQIADALGYAWGLGVVHRDVKPGNILLADARTAKLCDLGLAKVTTDPSMTLPNVLLGTPYYMSPEQVRGEPLDGRSDLYALGATLFELLTGDPAFEGKSVPDVLHAHEHTPPPDVRAWDPRFSGATAELVFSLLAKRREDRPGDGTALAREMLALATRLRPRG